MSKLKPIITVGGKLENKVKLGLPSLCAYGSDDESEEELEEEPTPKLKNLNPTKKDSTLSQRSGLLSILPPPKSSLQNSSFTKKLEEPKIQSVDKKPNIFSSDLYQKAKKLKTDEEPKIPEPVTVTSNNNNKLGSFLEYEYEEDPDPFPEEKNEEQEVESNNEEEELVEEAKIVKPAVFDQEALIKLCGSQAKKKGLDSIELLDVGVSDIVGNNKAELMKQITSEYRPPSNKDYFSSSSKKTHHVTYLAKVAVERDQELRNQWAQNKFARQQAKQRYGF
ncbi:unnamed protein product [Brachionus calyciflorus]|uniref:Proline-rich protein PRCC n=1 Tax=Brachionus calyciflorus TaxID=104777 RepID=A0A813VBS8_9BILA|nr:unnamed protein product [Brachionus calyciflorus]